MNRQQQKAHKQHQANWNNTADFSSNIVLNSKQKNIDTAEKKQIQKNISQRQKDPLHKADSDEQGGILETDKPNLDLQQSLMKARTAKGLNQKQLAQQLQIQLNVLQSYESGKEVPNNQMIAKIERLLGAKLPRNSKK